MKLSDINRSPESPVEQRAELLARLVLTRRRGVKVIDARQQGDVGLDLLVQITEPVQESGVVPVFGVQVKGTSEPLPDEASANKYVAARWDDWSPGQVFLFPIVLLLFSMQDDTGYFGWIMRPDVSSDGNPSLTKEAVPSLARVQHGVVSTVFGRVHKWYGAMAKAVVAEAKGK